MTPARAIKRLAKFAKRRGTVGLVRAMRMLDVKGVPQVEDACVLAVYLGRACPRYSFEVDGWDIAARDDDGDLVACRHTPDDAVTFIENFDSGRYPELMAG